MRHYVNNILRSRAARTLAILLAGVAVCAIYGQVPAPRKASEKVKSYTRPKPTKPVKPTMPQENRNRPDRFYLEKADILYADDRDTTDRQIVSGNVVFRRMGMTLSCDSAFYFPSTSSLEAFGHVKMLQGDSIRVDADYADYDGPTQMAQLMSYTQNVPVKLQHTSKSDRSHKELTTEILNYDLVTQEASYVYGGKMTNRNLRTQQTDTLTSIVGTYNTGTKIAEVSENVYLRNRTSRMRTNRLIYHADTRVVDIVERASIASGSDSILTDGGRYDSSTGNALLSTRSLIAHRDSAGNLTTLEGDSIVYDNVTRESRAFMFSDRNKHPRPMVITDTARHAVLIGGFGYYNDSSRFAYAEQYPLLKEYSNPDDTIFLRADRVELITRFLGSPQLQRDSTGAVADTIPGWEGPEHHIAKAYNRSRFFRNDIQGIADSITFVSLDSMLYLNRKPIVWNGNRLISGPEIIVHFNDSAPEWAKLPKKGLVAEAVEEGFYNQLRGGYLYARFRDKDLKHIDAHTDVQTIFLPMEKDSTYNKLVNAQGDTLAVDLDQRKMQKVKLWARHGADVNGQVTPLFTVTKQQYYLPDFIRMAGAKRFSEMDEALLRLEGLRPKYSWYSGGWEDALGELSFDLEDYFANPELGIVEDLAPVKPNRSVPAVAGPPSDTAPEPAASGATETTEPAASEATEATEAEAGEPAKGGAQ